MSRKPLSKKLRFEVFKRDRFTCQYCGAKAPDVVLHCDHIRPVADGGGNEILNLVTACIDCNGGKGARKLDDRSLVEKQRVQIEELDARREQLEMMLQWRDQAEKETVDTVSEVAARIAERGGFEPNENGRNDIRRWFKTYTLKEILAGLDAAFDQHMVWDGDEPVDSAWEAAFKAIPVMAKYHRLSIEKPYMQRLAYVQGILRRRFDDRYGQYLTPLENVHVGYLIPVETLEAEAKRADSWEGYGEALIEIAKLNPLNAEFFSGED